MVVAVLEDDADAVYLDGKVVAMGSMAGSGALAMGTIAGSGAFGGGGATATALYFTGAVNAWVSAEQLEPVIQEPQKH